MDYYLRDAVEADMELLFRWANDPEVRKNSFSTRSITWEEHKNWFADVLENPKIRQYIFMCDGQEVGQIRIRMSKDGAEIGYSIGAEFRGRGYAGLMVACLKEKVREELPEVKTLIARVKPENTASRKVFLNAGYHENGMVFDLSLED